MNKCLTRINKILFTSGSLTGMGTINLAVTKLSCKSVSVIYKVDDYFTSNIMMM